MCKTKWSIQQLLTAVSTTNEPMTRPLMEILAEELESAISGGKLEKLSILQESLGRAISTRFSALPPEQRRSLVQSSDHSEAYSSFTLGQLEFAQLLASQVAQRRPNEDFVAALNDRKFVEYVRLLNRAECTNVELASALSVADETVSRNLKKMRAIGITDYRREGQNVINFLSPAARSLFKDVAPALNIASEAPKKKLAALKDGIPQFLKHTLTLSSDVDSPCAVGA